MVKKVKNQKGFTLVELLAVIVILGIIAAIAVPSINGIINNTQERADEAEIEVIEEAARTAFTVEGGIFDGSQFTAIPANFSEGKKTGDKVTTITITVQTLIDEDYLDNDVPAGTVTYDGDEFLYSAS